MPEPNSYSALEEYLAQSLAADQISFGSPPPWGEAEAADELTPMIARASAPSEVLEPSMAPEIKDDGVSRLLLLLRHLSAAGERGLSRSELIRLAGYAAKDSHGEETMMQRDLRSLRSAGWPTENVADEGAEGRYVLHRRDLAGLSAGEKSLLQALLDLHAENGLPNPADRDVPECIWEVAKAVDHHSLLSMVYKGHRREVHPVRLHTTPAGWWLRARAEDGMVKWFRLDRMSHVELDAPWTADADIDDPGDSLNPHTWAEDPPVTVDLAVPSEHGHAVLLTFPHASVRHVDGGEDRVGIEVTNRAAFFGWLVEMGTRVRLLGPPEVLDDVRARLDEVARA